MKEYLIHERFSTFQGEGVHMGKPAFFIRTYGCPVKCPWCDSAGTWHKDFVPKEVERFAPIRLANEALLAGPDIVVITGGEPTVQDLAPLCDFLHNFGRRVHLETSGAFPIQGNFDWITLSPKRWKLPLDENLAQADEFKVIVEHVEDISFYTNVITRVARDTPIWLHPEWGHRNDPEVLNAIINTVKLNQFDFRAGYQLHKLYKADTLDPRARISVPLGGDVTRGESS